MKKLTGFLKKYAPTKRKWMQLYFALLFNANLKGFVTGNIYTGATKVACAPGINCYSCPGAVGACPLGSLQGALSAERSTLYYVGGILLLYSLLFGRMICGWLCPFGLVQELLHKIKTPKIHKGPVTRLLSYLKYVILVFFVLVVPLLYALRDTPLPAFCKYICPAGTLEGGMALLANKINDSYFSMLGPIFTWKFLLMVSLLVGCIFVFRLFCRFLCPLGALYGLFNRLSLFGIRLNRDACVDCGKCISHCKMDIRSVGDAECISCGECAPLCPTGAIQWKGPHILVRGNEGLRAAPAQKPAATGRSLALRCVTVGLLLALLAGTVGYYWRADTQRQADPPGVGQESRGNQIGQLCYGYDLAVVTGAGETGETVNPAATGRVTLLNFWGTWCTPCVNELPYFDRIATQYADRVTVIAAHGMNAVTGPAYIAQYYPSSAIIFANDYIPADGTYENGYYATLGGRGTYPYTLVLDADGRITHIFYSSVTYEMLREAVEENLA